MNQVGKKKKDEDVSPNLHKVFKHGDLIINVLPVVIVLTIWSIIVITFYAPIVMKSPLMKRIILIILLLLPYIATGRPFVVHYKKFLSEKPFTNFLWPRCMLVYDDPKIKK